jgi:WD40 repeat protein
MQQAEHFSAVSAGEWRALATLWGHAGTVCGVALSRNGHLVVSSGEDGTVRLGEARTRRPLATLRGHTGIIRGLAVSADGRVVVSGGADRTVRMWDAENGRPLAILEGHTGTVWGVALSADGELAASGSFDGTVKLWKTKSGACLRTLEPERRYERLNTTGLKGITEAQRQALIGLGAIDLRASRAGPGATRFGS